VRAILTPSIHPFSIQYGVNQTEGYEELSEVNLTFTSTEGVAYTVQYNLAF